MHCKRWGSEKSTFLAIFWGLLIFSGSPFSRNSTRKPFKFNIKSPIFTNTPCKSTCLYKNAPSYAHCLRANHKGERRKGTLQKHPLDDRFPARAPSPLLRAPSSTPTPKTPETQTMVWVFPFAETQTMVWVSPFPSKYRVWGGLSFGPSFSRTLLPPIHLPL